MIETRHVTPDMRDRVASMATPQLLPHCLRAFDVLVETAIAGARCPNFAEFYALGVQQSSSAIGKLADLGFIHVEVGGRNWRQVWICVGPHRGKATAGRLPAVESYYVRGPGRPA